MLRVAFPGRQLWVEEACPTVVHAGLTPCARLGDLGGSAATVRAGISTIVPLRFRAPTAHAGIISPSHS